MLARIRNELNGWDIALRLEGRGDRLAWVDLATGALRGALYVNEAQATSALYRLFSEPGMNVQIQASTSKPQLRLVKAA